MKTKQSAAPRFDLIPFRRSIFLRLSVPDPYLSYLSTIQALPMAPQDLCAPASMDNPQVQLLLALSLIGAWTVVCWAGLLVKKTIRLLSSHILAPLGRALFTRKVSHRDRSDIIGSHALQH